MVTAYRRSHSFPNPPLHISSKSQNTLHVRSSSLPCRSNPVIHQLRDEISALQLWYAAYSPARTSAWLCDGLFCLNSLHESLHDLLHLPQTRDSLCGGDYSDLIENLLEDFLRFVDVYGTFQTLVLRLKEEYSAAQIAVRRKGNTNFAVHSKNLNKIAKEIGKLSSNFINIGKSASARQSYDEEGDLFDVIDAVVKATVIVSNALFCGISNSAAFRKPCRTGLNFGRKSENVKVERGIMEFRGLNLENLTKKSEEELKMAWKKMQEMEDRVLEIEQCGERVFRSLINTRASLLNVLTQ